MKAKTHKKYIATLSSLVFLTTISTIVLSRAPDTTTTNAVGASTMASVTVPDVCSMSSAVNIDNQHIATVAGASYTANIGETLISVNCNDGNGYSVYAVGFTNNTEGTTILMGDATNLTIPTGTGTSTTTSNWAMKLTSVSGASAPSILSDSSGSFENYHAVPATATKVVTRTSNTTSPSEFKTTYAVAVSGSQPPDTYTGQVKYTLVHPSYAMPDGTVSNYIQDFTLSACQQLANSASYTVYDRRDDSDYTVRYIEGACWMTQNLRITGVISATDSNFTGSDVNISQYDSTDRTNCGYPNGYDNICSHTPGATEISRTGQPADQLGVWYNYAAATAGTIAGLPNTASPTEDICPSGWHLPSRGSSNTIGSFENLANASSASILKFNPINGGVYADNSFYNEENGQWWSSSSMGESAAYILGYYVDTNNNASLYASAGNNRYGGYNIRCVRTD